MGRQTHHTKTGLPVCCEQALKSVGEQNTHGGCRCGDLRETARAKEVTLRGGVERLCITTSQLDLFWPANFRPIPQKDSAWDAYTAKETENRQGEVGSLRYSPYGP